MKRGRIGITRGAIVGCVLVALTLAGCTSANGSEGTSKEEPIEALRVPMTSFLSSTYYKQKIDWRTCDTHLQCGRVKVPLDWQNIDGGSIHISMIRHRATGSRVGALVVDPGGPGESGVELVDSGVENAVDSTVSKHYDVIGLDPRGVGYSTPITCFSDKQQDAYLYAPTIGTIGSRAWIADERRRARTFADTCASKTGPLIGHVDTVNAAHDMDVIRAALGEKKLNYLGYSYGTYLGTVYAGLYPQRVGRFVFDGPDNPWETTGGGGIDVSQAVGFDHEFTTFLGDCLNGSREATGNAACAFSGSLDSAVKTVEALLASADEHPIAAKGGRVLDGSTLATGISEALYDTSEWPQLNKALGQVMSGKATEALSLADEYNGRDADGTYYDNSAAAFAAISCLEGGSSVDLGYDARELKKLEKDAPLLGKYDGYGDLQCGAWKYGPSVFPKPIHAADSGPILMVATTGDPATPYGDAKQLAKQLVTSHLVTYHGDGHTAYALGHPCVDNAVDAYLISGTVPKTDPDCRD